MRRVHYLCSCFYYVFSPPHFPELNKILLLSPITHLKGLSLHFTFYHPFHFSSFSLWMPFVTVITSAYFLRQMIGYWPLLQKPDLIFTSKMFDTILHWNHQGFDHSTTRTKYFHKALIIVILHCHIPIKSHHCLCLVL